MRAVVQRVSEASVLVGEELVASIRQGLLVLVGVSRTDSGEEARRLAEKLARVRFFDGDGGRMDRSLLDLGERAAALCVSQFTLYGDVRRGLRPSFTEAAGAEQAQELYERFCEKLAGHGVRVEQGRFGAMMTVSLKNEGPVTLVVETGG